MANRDLFRGADMYESRRREAGGGLTGFWQRLLMQAAVALALFCGVVYLYEQESELGEGVRYIVALAQADEQELLAVGGFSEVWQSLLTREDSQEDNSEQNNNADNNINNNAEKTGEPASALAANGQPGDYLASAQVNSEGNLVMILPASGLMQGAFGDVDERGLQVSGLKIYCQSRQEVSAAAIGEVTQVISGEKIVLSHRDGVETCYIGGIEPAVSVGDTLRQGQLLGYVQEGSLLFEVLQEGEPADPFLYVKGPQ